MRKLYFLLLCTVIIIVGCANTEEQKGKEENLSQTELTGTKMPLHTFESPASDGVIPRQAYINWEKKCQYAEMNEWRFGICDFTERYLRIVQI